jgi:hypothetical protein
MPQHTIPTGPSGRLPSGSLRAALGAGRSSTRRGLAGLVIAPAMALGPCWIPLAAVYIAGRWMADGALEWSLASAIQLTVITYLLLTGLTIAIGGPTWIVLRLARRESGFNYVLAGMAEALFCAVFAGYSGHGLLRLDQMMAFAFCGGLGGYTAFVFWLIAREARAATKGTPS